MIRQSTTAVRPCRQPAKRKHRGNARKSNHERDRVAHCERACETERLYGSRHHLRPRAVHRHLLEGELRAIRKAAGIPSESFRPVILGVELVDRDAVVARGGDSEYERKTKDGAADHQLGIEGPRGFLLLARADRAHAEFRIGSSAAATRRTPPPGASPLAARPPRPPVRQRGGTGLLVFRRRESPAKWAGRLQSID